MSSTAAAAAVMVNIETFNGVRVAQVSPTEAADNTKIEAAVRASPHFCDSEEHKWAQLKIVRSSGGDDDALVHIAWKFETQTEMVKRVFGPACVENVVCGDGDGHIILLALRNLRPDMDPQRLMCLNRLTHLQTLDLNHNKLTELPGPEWLSRCLNLKWLSLFNNKLTALPGPTWLSRCLELQTLYLSSNILTKLPGPDWLSQCSNLQWLHLSNNILTELPGPDWLSQCSKLQTLNLADNTFTPEYKTQIKSALVSAGRIVSV
jgi:hypothetical protein